MGGESSSSRLFGRGFVILASSLLSLSVPPTYPTRWFILHFSPTKQWPGVASFALGSVDYQRDKSYAREWDANEIRAAFCAIFYFLFIISSPRLFFADDIYCDRKGINLRIHLVRVFGLRTDEFYASDSGPVCGWVGYSLRPSLRFKDFYLSAYVCTPERGCNLFILPFVSWLRNRLGGYFEI